MPDFLLTLCHAYLLSRTTIPQGFSYIQRKSKELSESYQFAPMFFFVSRIKKFVIPNLFLPFDCVVKRNAPVDSPDFLDAGVTKFSEVFTFNVICRRNHIEQH